MGERTYRNDSATTRTVSWTSPSSESIPVAPGARFTFDPDAANGEEIDASCVAVGLVLVAGGG